MFGYLIEDIPGRNLEELFIECYTPGILEYLKSKIQSWSPEFEYEEKMYFYKSKLHRTEPVYVKLVSPKKIINDRSLFKIVIRKDRINSRQILLLVTL